jgi:hypothetical protein
LRSNGIAQVDAGLSFECQKSAGAVLIMDDVAYRQDAIENDHYRRYILEHHNSWLSFAKKQGRNIDLSELILVTGCDKTSDWACAAFSKTSKSASASLQVGGCVRGGLHVWGRWEHEGSVFANEGPKVLLPLVQTTKLVAGPARSSTLPWPLKRFFASSRDAESTKSSDIPVSPRVPSNQCVFLRGYRVCDRIMWFWRRHLRSLDDGFEYWSKPLLKAKKVIGDVSAPLIPVPGPGPSGGSPGSGPDGNSSFGSVSGSQPPTASSQDRTSGSASQTFWNSPGSSSGPADYEFSEQDMERLIALQSSLGKACWISGVAAD